MSNNKKTRRSFLSLVTGTAGGYLSSFILSNSAYSQTGFTDSDPNDEAGNGRGTGFTDNDPNDTAGNGRGTSQSSANSGLTDQDANDTLGNGRGTSRSGLTDSDPNDAGGNGRGTGSRNTPSSGIRTGYQVGYGDTRAEAYEMALEKVDSPDSCGRRSSPSGNFVTDYRETASGWRVEISYECF